MIKTRLGPIISGAAFLMVALSSAVYADEALAARSKAVVRAFYETVFIGRNVDAAPKFLAPGYIQHNPHVPTGLKGFMDDFRPRFAAKMPADYKREILNIVAENDMVVLYNRQTWTSSKDGQHHVYLQFDMFRVQNGMITEHWDADS
jgi:predicted SnoaL-like aldol condensation-catalyzing enzyme